MDYWRRKPFKTADGSMSLEVDGGLETYHSRHGALQESAYVFIQHGLEACAGAQSVLEVGFGTGLNALLAWQWAEANQRPLTFTTLELYPLQPHEWEALEFEVEIPGSPEAFRKLHSAEWGVQAKLSPFFTVEKRKQAWQDFPEVACTDVIFFDAFGPPTQPEMWTATSLFRAARALRAKGCFATYCAKGSVRRRLQRSGLEVVRLPGPPGKREMLQATAPAAPTAGTDRFNIRSYMVLLNRERSAVLMSTEWAAGMPMLKFPGGGMEAGEGPEECVCREALEELGQAVRVLEPYFITPQFQRSAFREKEQLLSLYFEVELEQEQQFETQETLALPEGPGPEQFVWVKWEQLKRVSATFPIDQKVVEKLCLQFA